MDKIINFPGQVSLRIRQGKDRFFFLVHVIFGKMHGEYENWPNGLRISRKDTAELIRKLRNAMKEIDSEKIS